MAATANGSTFLWSPIAANAPVGSSVVLNVPPLDGSAGQFKNPSGAAISSSGEVVTDAGPISHAALFVPSSPNGNSGTVTQLPHQSGVFYGANSINDTGQFTGNFSTQEMGRFDPTTPGATTGTYTEINSPGQGGAVYGNGESDGTSINAAGTIAGYGFQSLPGNKQALIWKTDGTVTDLNPLLGATVADASAINDANDVVGSADNHAFLYNGTGYNLNQLISPAAGWTLTTALGINNDGQIIGIGQLNGVNAAFLLTPTPEPASISVIAFGLGLLLRRETRQRRKL